MVEFTPALEFTFSSQQVFSDFFKSNFKLCGDVLGDDEFEDSLRLMLCLENIDINLKQDKYLPNLLLCKDSKKSNKF